MIIFHHIVNRSVVQKLGCGEGLLWQAGLFTLLYLGSMSISAEKYNNSNGRSNGGSRGGGGKDGRHLGEEQSTTLQRTLPEVEQEGEELLSEAYVHSLASLGLERLQNEPGRLHAEANAVDEVSRQRHLILPEYKKLSQFCD